jgi:hypothetical protein
MFFHGHNSLRPPASDGRGCPGFLPYLRAHVPE